MLMWCTELQFKQPIQAPLGFTCHLCSWDHSRAMNGPEAKAETWDSLQVCRKARRARAKSLTGAVFTEMVPVNLHHRDLLMNEVSCHRGSVALATQLG